MPTVAELEALLEPLPGFAVGRRTGWRFVQARERLSIGRLVDPIVGRLRVDVTRPGQPVPGTSSMIDTSTARSFGIVVDVARARARRASGPRAAASHVAGS